MFLEVFTNIYYFSIYHMQKTNTQTNEKKKTKKKRKLPEMISEKHFTQLLSGKTMLKRLIKMRTGKMLDEKS